MTVDDESDTGKTMTIYRQYCYIPDSITYDTNKKGKQPNLDRPFVDNVFTNYIDPSYEERMNKLSTKGTNLLKHHTT